MSEAAAVAPLLLGDPSPALRHRVLTELLDVPPDDPEAADLAVRRQHAPEVVALAELAERAGSGPTDLRAWSWLLCRWAHLGFDRSHPPVAALVGRVLDQQQRDGSFPLSAFRADDRYSMVPLQVALPLRGLAAVGCATDDGSERAYEWLLDRRLDDGSWPAGEASGQPAYVAGYRELPGSVGCRANTEAALACLVLHPERRHDGSTSRALDLLLRRQTRDEWALGTEVARLAGVDDATGFFTFYARFDLAFVLDLASRVDGSGDDPRVRDLATFLLDRRGAGGLWEHPTHPDLSRWLTFAVLLGLRRLPVASSPGHGR
jgi:hypothetical protein